jgi:invasion protein IalB
MTDRCKVLAPAFAFVVAAAAMLGAANAADMVKEFGAWKTYRHGAGEQRMCFAVSEANDVEPQGAKRQKPHIYVTAWPAAGLKAEISVLVGHALRKGAKIGLDIDGTRFELFPDGDRAYVSDAAVEAKLLDAMRAGRSMVVTATSAAGQQTRDAYSLAGVTAAIQSLATICP